MEGEGLESEFEAEEHLPGTADGGQDEEEYPSSGRVSTTVSSWHSLLRAMGKDEHDKGPCILGKVKLRVSHTWPDQARMAPHKFQWVDLPRTTTGALQRVKCCALHSGDVMLVSLFPRGSPLFQDLFMCIDSGMDPLHVVPVQEKVLDAVNIAQVRMKSTKHEILGQFFLTTHRLIFIPDILGSLRQGASMKIPLSWVLTAKAIPHQQESCLATLHVQLKDGRGFFIGIRQENYYENLEGPLVQSTDEAILAVKHWEEEIKWRVEENKFHVRISQHFSPSGAGNPSTCPSPHVLQGRSRTASKISRRPSTDCVINAWPSMGLLPTGSGEAFKNSPKQRSTPNLQSIRMAAPAARLATVSLHSSERSEPKETSILEDQVNLEQLKVKLSKLSAKDNGSPRSKGQITPEQSNWSAASTKGQRFRRSSNASTTPRKRSLTNTRTLLQSPARSPIQSPSRSERNSSESLFFEEGCRDTPSPSTGRIDLAAEKERKVIMNFKMDFEKEFDRQGVQDSGAWKLTQVNNSYQVCRTYPQLLAVPSCLSDEDIKAAAKWRINNRIPALTWLHPYTGAPLCRSSQPKLGLTNLTCPEDETLVNAIRKSARKYVHQHSQQASLYTLRNSPLTAPNPRRGLKIQAPPMKKTTGPFPRSGSWMEVNKENNVLTTTPVLDQCDTNTSRGFSPRRVRAPTLKPRSKGALLRTDIMDDPPETVLSDTEGVSPGLYRRGLAGRWPSKKNPKSQFLNFTRQSQTQDDMPLGPCCQRTRTVLRIIDARSATAAKGNQLIGGGHESVSKLGGKQNCQLQFLNLPNIHTIRESFHAFNQACCLDYPQETWLQALHDSKWLHHLNNILVGAVMVSKYLEQGDPVLVHCSDGWDRTAQVCSLAQLMLDPFYRTIKGLQVLIDKDWCSFGHMFDMRNGWDNLMSPIFLQFLDCLWQMMQQFPDAFEYNEELLFVLFKASHSRCFGTFLGDCEKDRIDLLLKTSTQSYEEPAVSIWACILQEKARYTNVIYRGSRHGYPSLAIYPNTGIQSLRVWEKLYFQEVTAKVVHYGPRPCTREEELERVVLEQKAHISTLSELTLGERFISKSKEFISRSLTPSTDEPNNSKIKSPTMLSKKEVDDSSISSTTMASDDEEENIASAFLYAAAQPLKLLLRSRDTSQLSESSLHSKADR